MSSGPPGGEGADGARRGEPPQNIATAIAEVSERATLLVREEIELAKAEVAEKASKLARGAIVGAAAGVFLLTALIFVLIGCAWLLYYFIPGGDFTYFWGFFAMAALLVVLGVIAGLLAARFVKRSTPPVPSMAIEEARKIRDAVSTPPASGSSGAQSDVPGPASATVGASAAAPQPDAAAAGDRGSGTPATAYARGAAAATSPAPPDTSAAQTPPAESG